MRYPKASMYIQRHINVLYVCTISMYKPFVLSGVARRTDAGGQRLARGSTMKGSGSLCVTPSPVAGSCESSIQWQSWAFWTMPSSQLVALMLDHKHVGVWTGGGEGAQRPPLICSMVVIAGSKLASGRAKGLGTRLWLWLQLQLQSLLPGGRSDIAWVESECEWANTKQRLMIRARKDWAA